MRSRSITEKTYKSLKPVLSKFKKSDLPKLAKLKMIQINGQFYSVSSLYRIYEAETWEDFESRKVDRNPHPRKVITLHEVSRKEKTIGSEPERSEPERSEEPADCSDKDDYTKQLTRIADALEKLVEYWKPLEKPQEGKKGIFISHYLKNLKDK